MFGLKKKVAKLSQRQKLKMHGMKDRSTKRGSYRGCSRMSMGKMRALAGFYGSTIQTGQLGMLQKAGRFVPEATK